MIGKRTSPLKHQSLFSKFPNLLKVYVPLGTKRVLSGLNTNLLCVRRVEKLDGPISGKNPEPGLPDEHFDRL